MQRTEWRYLLYFLDFKDNIIHESTRVDDTCSCSFCKSMNPKVPWIPNMYLTTHEETKTIGDVSKKDQRKDISVCNAVVSDF